MSVVFVTATGTEVGKTYVACGLIRALRRAGREVDVLKPTQSGFDPARPQESDAALLIEATGATVTPATIAAVAPFRYVAALAPHMAARREGKTLAAADVIATCRDRIATHRGTLVIEGAGGVMSPLDSTHTMLDLAAALAAPVVLVAGSYLGTISHTLTAVAVLRQRAVPITALVVSETENAGVPLDETAEAVRGFVADLPVLELPRFGAASRHPVFEDLAQRV